MRKVSGRKRTVFCALSGGVDSSVAALLLKKQGDNVVGVFMKNWTEKVPGLIYPRTSIGEGVNCPWEEDQRFARLAAAKIGIPLYTWDFEKEYKKQVFEYFLDSYQSGETPNPDVVCNKLIKFGLFLDKTKKMGADCIATGHYVKLKQSLANRTTGFSTPAVENQLHSRPDDSGRAGDQARRDSEGFSWPNSVSSSLFIAKDKNKDQSYFLWTLTQEQLRYCLFPLGNLTKPEVRKIAKKAGLATADRKDSQGLCFVGPISLKDFLKPYIKEKKGNIVLVAFDKKGNKQEKIIGEHQGIHLFTFGQRQGIGIGGGKPYFVVGKDIQTNTLYVSLKENMAKFFPKEVSVKNINWINPDIIKLPLKCLARYRYRQPLQQIRVVRNKKEEIKVLFKKPAVAITPGQSIVFYKGKTMLGGGIIA
jgi:tRNA-specific 2-thiouridylase